MAQTHTQSLLQFAVFHSSFVEGKKYMIGYKRTKRMEVKNKKQWRRTEPIMTQQGADRQTSCLYQLHSKNVGHAAFLKIYW